MALRTVCLAFCLVVPLTTLPQHAPAAEPDELPVDEVVFAVRKPGPDGHWYANFGYYCEGPNRVAYTAGSQLCRLNLRTGKLRVLLDDPQGTIRDPQLSYDGQRILFSYRPGNSMYFHLYEMSIDGTGLRQITDGPFDDIEPTYVPDGGIVFCSSRSRRWVKCWLVQVATLYRVERDGSGLMPLSAANATENTPWVLPDGRILYTRWEYVDRSQVHYHHLWVMNPDGTGQMVLFGNLYPGTVMIDAKPIPGSEKIVAIFSPGHGRREHQGAVTIVDPRLGPDVPSAARQITKSQDYRDPYPLTQDLFLVARGPAIELLDSSGNARELYRLPKQLAKQGMWIHEPRPVQSRPVEPVIPHRIDPTRATGQVVLLNVYAGRNMQGVRRGEIKKLLILETLPKPINYTGGMDPLTYGGSFSLERVVGTVPVEPDGSAYFELPALRSFFFVALDENDMSVKRMQSFMSVQPGEVVSCFGCHEKRNETASPNTGPILALQRPPSKVEPIEGVPDVLDFPRDVQPILDRHCVACHDYEPTAQGGPYAGGVILTGDHGPMFSHSYYTLTVRRLFSDGRDLPRSEYPPRAIGSSASRILKMIDGSHYGARLSRQEATVLRLWIETGATYPGTYAALGTGMIGGYHENRQVNTDWDWPTTKAGAAAIRKRCARCHNGPRQLPLALSDERNVSFWRPSLDDPRLKYSRHIVFNLSRPDKSLLLLAPLAREAGGLQLCRSITEKGRPTETVAVFTDRNDPDYQTLLRMVKAGKEYLDKIKRFDMPGFVPRPEYLREMQRYGVLPPDWKPGQPVDPYELDQAYWRSLWYVPRRSP